jgi:hypothetical protein
MSEHSQDNIRHGKQHNKGQGDISDDIHPSADLFGKPKKTWHKPSSILIEQDFCCDLFMPVRCCILLCRVNEFFYQRYLDIEMFSIDHHGDTGIYRIGGHLRFTARSPKGYVANIFVIHAIPPPFLLIMISLALFPDCLIQTIIADASVSVLKIQGQVNGRLHLCKPYKHWPRRLAN